MGEPALEIGAAPIPLPVPSKLKLLGKVIPLFKEGPGHSGTLIHMRNVPGKPLHRALDQALPCPMWDGCEGPEEVPQDFEWDGSSVPWVFQGLFPRHNHPIASCRHDWRCKQARNAEERSWADAQFKKDVSTTSWWITAQIGYIGVRVGATFGIGNNF